METRTAKVYARHSADCKHREQGGDFKGCNCPKWICFYDGATKRQWKESAKTRTWEKAQDQAVAWLEQFDPVKVKVKQLEAEIEAQRGTTVSIEKAVFSYLQDQIFRLGDNGTVSRTRILLGDVDENNKVKRGKMFAWLDKQMPRPTLISEMTTPMLAAWRSSWSYGSDRSAAQAWSEVLTFFKFCHRHGWVKANPAAALARPRVQKGNRTATFTDEQYDSILSAAHGDQMLETFVELLRWGGMALIDAVQFERKSLDATGTLRYKRQKTDELATVDLPENVLALLRSVPGGEQPFLRSSISPEGNAHAWRRQLQALFAKAGITVVKTDVGERPAHPHMLRDTCAVWYLRHGMGLHGVAKILGHSNPLITSKSYLPFVKELETAHIAENRAVLEAAKPKETGKVRAIRS